MSKENSAIANEIGALILATIGGKDPTFEEALDIFAYHIGEIMTAREHVKVYFWDDVIGEYRFKLDGAPSYGGEAGNPHPGDTAYVDGLPIGNRCAARNDYAKRCAVVLGAIALREHGPQALQDFLATR